MNPRGSFPYYYSTVKFVNSLGMLSAYSVSYIALCTYVQNDLCTVKFGEDSGQISNSLSLSLSLSHTHIHTHTQRHTPKRPYQAIH